MKMSDYFIRFIPEKIDTELNQSEIKLIDGLSWGGIVPKYISSERIQFADAGQNFEVAKCPFCRNNLMEWWGETMSSSYSNDLGFVEIDKTTPCCNMRISLHNLEYNFPQGFYKTMIEICPKVDSQIDSEKIAERLEIITKGKWRIIHAHY
jgi:hypothetical protein